MQNAWLGRGFVEDDGDRRRTEHAASERGSAIGTSRWAKKYAAPLAILWPARRGKLVVNLPYVRSSRLEDVV